MKTLSTFFLLFYCAGHAMAQDLSKPYRINGYLKDVQTPNGYVYLRGNIGDSAKVRTDSALLTDGHFSFSGNAEPTMVKLYTQRMGHPHYINPISFMIDSGEITVSANYDTLQTTWFGNVKITGSAAEKENKELAEKTKRLYDLYDIKKLQAGYKDASEKKDTATVSMFTAVFKEINAKAQSIVSDFVKAHPNSFVSLHQIRERMMYMDEKSMAENKAAFLELSPAVQFSSLGRKTAERMAYSSRGMLLNIPAGDFAQPNVAGKLVKLSDFKGKYVLLDFWASWCGPCRAENPNVLSAYKKFKDKGFDILAVSLDSDREKWKKAIAEDKLPWAQVSDLKQSQNAAVQQFGVSGIPDNFLIDPKGIVVARGLRGEALQKKLEELMGHSQ